MLNDTNTYIVSARKYRPQSFATIVGQEHVTNTLKNAILNNQIAQSYLFFGPRGVGKTTCARVFAKTINCLNLQNTGEACNECASCKAFNSNTSFNIYELDAASNNSVEDIRQLIDQVRYPPQIGKYKVYIIDEVHMLSTAAFNAFLKTLEEPPTYAKFILATTEKNKVLPTILSRCQVFNFNRIKTEDIAKYLERIAAKENHKFESEAIRIIAQKADGGLRDACSIYDQMVAFTQGNITTKAVIENLHVVDYDYYFQMTEAFLTQDHAKVLLLLDNILSKGFDPLNVLVGLMDHLRYLLLSKNPQTLVVIDLSDAAKSAILEQSRRCSERFLLNALSILNKADVNFKTSRHQRLHLEIHLLQIANIQQTITESEKKNSLIEDDNHVFQQYQTKNINTTSVTTQYGKDVKIIKVSDKPVLSEVIVKTTASLKEVNSSISSQYNTSAISKEVKPEEKILNVPDTTQNAYSAKKHAYQNDIRNFENEKQTQVNEIREPLFKYDKTNPISSDTLVENSDKISVSQPQKHIDMSGNTQSVTEKRYYALLSKNPLLEEFKVQLKLEFK